MSALVSAEASEAERHLGPVIHLDLDQGSEQWFAVRCGLLTASEMKLIVTPTLKIASNEKERTHLYELLAQRITKHVEPSYVSDDMLRGREDEIEAFDLYCEHFGPAERVGFITNDKWGFTLGYSPDGVVGDNGLIECKGRRQKYQVQTWIQHALTETVPEDFLIQVQTGLLVSERKWLDFLSFCGGLPLVRIRVYPDEKVQKAVLNAAEAFEDRLAAAHCEYCLATGKASKLIPTKRRPLDITL